MSRKIPTIEQLDELRKQQNQKNSDTAGSSGRSVPSVERLEELRKNQNTRTVPSDETLNRLRSGSGTGSAGSAQGSKTDTGSAASAQGNKTDRTVQAEGLSWRALTQKRQAAEQNPYAEALEVEKKKGFFSALGENFVQGTRQAVGSIGNAMMEQVASAWDPETNLSYRLALALAPKNVQPAENETTPSLGVFQADMTPTEEGLEKLKERREGLRSIIEKNTKTQQEEKQKLADKYDSSDVMTKAGQIIGQGVGSMVPAAAAGLVAGPVGSSLAMFQQGYGQGYVGAKQDGATEQQARMNAAGSGLVSAGVEAISGSIGGLRLPGSTGVVDDLVSGFIDGNVKNKTLKQLAKYLADATGEGLEEVAEDLLQPIVEKLSYGKKTGVEKLADGETTLGEIGAELGEDFLGGFLTSAFLGGAQKMGQTILDSAGNAGQNAAQVQQDTGKNAAQVQQTGQEAVSAAQSAQNTPDDSIIKNAVAEENETQNVPVAAQASDPAADKVTEWADGNDKFSPRMKSVAKSNFQPGTDADTYMDAVQTFYNAGRKGKEQSFEKLLKKYKKEADAINNEPLLQSLYEIGLQEAHRAGYGDVAQAIRNWADGNDSFSEAMKSFAKENYRPGTNENVYMGAMQSFYDAGRGGVMSFEQASGQNRVRAAVMDNEQVLRAAFDLGRSEAANVMDEAGAGAVQGTVEYEEGTTPGAVLSEEVVQAVADKLGVNIRVVQQLTDSAGGEANGHWAAALSQIALGENSSNGYQTLMHELTHYMGSYNAEGWNSLRNAALNWYARNGRGVDAALYRYGELYGNYTMGVDEAARDVLSGVMSTEEGARSFLEYITRTDEYTVPEKRSILNTMREMLETLVEKVRGLLRGGDATGTAMNARRAAERADALESRRALIDAYLQTLEGARENARGLQAGAVNADVQGETENNVSFSYPEDMTLEEIMRESAMEMTDMPSITEVNLKYATISGKKPVEAAIDFFQEIGGKVERDGFGTVLLTKRGVRNDLSHGFSAPKLATIRAVPDVIKYGKIIDEQSNWKKRGYDSVTIMAPVTVIDSNDIGHRTYVGVIIKKDVWDTERRFHLHEVIDSDGNRIAFAKTNKEKDTPINTGPYTEEISAGTNTREGVSLKNTIPNGEKYVNGKNADAGVKNVDKRYSINPDFDREITEWDKGGRKEDKVFTLGTTGDALKSIGVKDRGIVMLGRKIRIILEQHPGMTMDMIRQIPAMLEEPSLVLESTGASMKGKTTANSRIVVIGTVTDSKGNPVLCALDVQPGARNDLKMGLQDFNKVSSAYAKEHSQASMLEKSNVLYVSPDKKKAGTALRSFGFQGAPSERTGSGSLGSITYGTDGVKIKGVPFEEVFGKSLTKVTGKTVHEPGARESRKTAAALDLENERKWRRQAETENARLARENSRMEDQIGLLKQETKLSGGHLMDIEAVKTAAKELVKEYSSKYDPDVLERELRHAFEAMATNSDSENGLNVDEAMETLKELARGVIEQSRQLDTDVSEAYAPVKDVIRGMAWTVRKNSNTYYDLLDAFGDGENGKKWGNVRKALFSRLDVKLVDENGPAGTLDTNFETLARDYPGEFDSESDAVANVRRVLEIYELSKPQLVNQYGNDIDGAASFAAQKLYQQYLTMPRRKTFADVNTAGADELARQYTEQLNRTLEEQKEQYENKLAYLRRTEGQRVQEGILERKAALQLRWEKREQRAERAKSRDSVQKSVSDLYRWLTKPTAQDHVQTRMQKTVLDLLNAIDPNDSRAGTKSAARWQEVMKDLQIVAERSINADTGMADTDSYADFDPDLPGMIDTMLNGYESVKVKDLDSRGMKQLADIMTTVKTSIRNANRMMADEQNRVVEEVARKSAAEMEAEKKTLLKQRSNFVKSASNSWLGKNAERLLNFDMMDARRYFKTLGQTASNSVYEPIRKGFDKRVWLLEEAQKQFAIIKGDTDVSKWTGDKAEKQHFRFENGMEADLTVGQMMELYNLSQRQQAHDHLMQGGIVLVDQNGNRQQERINLTPKDLAMVTGSLTTEQVKMAKKMSQYLSDRNGPSGWGNEVSQKLYGLDKFNEKNYWPIKSDNNQTRTSDSNASSTASLWALKNLGFTKNLTNFANNSVLIGDAFDTWSNHVANMATYNSMVVPLSDAMKWFNWRDGVNTSTKEQIQNLCGDAGKNYFITLMQDVNGMSAKPSQTGFAALTAKFTRKWKIAKVGANLRVAVQQPTAYLRAGAEISPKYLMGALTVDVKKMKHGMEMAENHCAIAKWKSWGYFETGIGRSMKDVLTGQGSWVDSLREKSTWMAEMGDRMTWGTLWNACELEAKDKGLQEGSEGFTSYCADRLSDIVDKTQVVDTVLHRSQLMRSKDSIAQMETNFFAEPTKTYNMVMEAVMDAAHGKAGSGKKLGRVAATYLVTTLGTAAAASLVDAVRVKDEDRDKDFEERYTKVFWDNFVSNIIFVNNIPIVKDALNVWDGYSNTRTDLEMVSDAVNAIQMAVKLYKGESKATPYKLMSAVANAFSSLTGIPAATALRDTKSLYDMLTDLQDPLRIDRQFGRKEGDYTYDDLFNHVKQEGGDTKAFRALYKGKTYQEMLGTQKAAGVDAWAQALAKETAVTEEDGTVKDNTEVLARHLGNVITYTDADGNSRKIVLDGNEYLSYASSVQKKTVDILDEYRKGAGNGEGGEQKADFAQMAREYSVECAREELIAGYEPDSWVSTVQEISDDLGTVRALLARQIVKNTKADVDEDGNTVPGSKAANAVQELRSAGYDAAQAQAIYSILSGTDDSQYLKLYRQVKKDGGNTDQLAALFGVNGETASYAAMTGKKDAGKVDSYLKGLSMSDGSEVLPDHVAAAFGYTVDGVKYQVELEGKEYLSYARQRTETAYDLTALFMPEADSYDSGFQAAVVNAIEEYANQTAKASYSGYQESSWVQKIQDEAGILGGDVNGEVYSLLLARALINSSTGYKGKNGKTVSGSKKKEAIEKMQDAGYKKAYAEELYKLFG